MQRTSTLDNLGTALAFKGFAALHVLRGLQETASQGLGSYPASAIGFWFSQLPAKANRHPAATSRRHAGQSGEATMLRNDEHTPSCTARCSAAGHRIA